MEAVLRMFGLTTILRQSVYMIMMKVLLWIRRIAQDQHRMLFLLSEFVLSKKRHEIDQTNRAIVSGGDDA